MQAARECLVTLSHGQAELTLPSGVWVFLSSELDQAGFKVDEYSPEPNFKDGKPFTWTGIVLYENEVAFIRHLAASCRRQNIALRRTQY
jgi:hypothetical protein